MGKNHYTKREREGLCKKYQSSNKSRKAFCEGNGISTKSLSRWLLKSEARAKAGKFEPIGELMISNDILTEIMLPSGIKIKLRMEEAGVSRLIKGLVKWK